MRLGPLRHPWFAAFAGSVGLGGLGDEVARLALPLLILDLTHSIAAAATLRLVQALPYVFFGGILGVLIDRADKRKLLIACDALSVALTLTIPLSVAAGIFTLNLLYLIGFLLGTVEVARGVTTDFSVVPALAAGAHVHRESRPAGHPDPGALRAARGEPTRRSHDRHRALARRRGDGARELHRAAARAWPAPRPHAARLRCGGRRDRRAHRSRARLAAHRRRLRRAGDGVDELHHLRVRTEAARGPRAHSRPRERRVPHDRADLEQLLGAVPLVRRPRRELVGGVRGRRRLGAARGGGDLLHTAAPLQPERTRAR